MPVYCGPRTLNVISLSLSLYSKKAYAAYKMGSLGYAEKLSVRADVGGQLGARELSETQEALKQKLDQLATLVNAGPNMSKSFCFMLIRVLECRWPRATKSLLLLELGSQRHAASQTSGGVHHGPLGRHEQAAGTHAALCAPGDHMESGRCSTLASPSPNARQHLPQPSPATPTR